MSTSLDMSLDDLIKNNKTSEGGGRGGSSSFRGRGRARGGGGFGYGGGRTTRGGGSFGLGPTRRFQNRGIRRAMPYAISNVVGMYDMYAAAAVDTGSNKLYISNLDYGVSNEDIKELFSEVGEIQRYSVNYDRSGRSKGTAEVVFAQRSDAAAAVKRYNNVQLDGKPMKIEIVGASIAPPVFPAVNTAIFANPVSFPQRGIRRGGAMGRLRGGRGSGGRISQRGGGRGRGRGRGEKVSATDLDADLDKYHTEAMQIN
ncbi:THO complex subunit 4B-like [Papaver somniferum]|uniref:THO complex subunit 4B-like n=1 Tax=Papaver somniferum TaxID=3469 RepID=UPI000E70128F|nr:THO complex subunit 4B-like [Papaver somniferum]